MPSGEAASSSSSSRQVRISIDRGGTFTDVHASRGDNHEDIGFKLLSENPQAYDSAPAEAIRRVLEIVRNEKIPRDKKLPVEDIESIRMGTTIATNALLERRGHPTVLVVTKGFRDLLRIGTQARPNIFDLSATKLSQLYEQVIEVDERVTMATSAEDPDFKTISDKDAKKEGLVQGLTGEWIRVLTKPDLKQIEKDLKKVWDKGYRSLAISFAHSFTFTDHEDAVAELAEGMGFDVSASRKILPMINYVSRANGAVVDAYLTKNVRNYIGDFGEHFEGGLEALGGKLLFMQSDGGLCRWDLFSGARAILSGPAAGVVGFSKTCYSDESGPSGKKQKSSAPRPLLALDMGGTSTDVSRYDGKFDHVFESTISQTKLSIPMLQISTVAAGGGSRLAYRNNMFVVGPESAGSDPGPTCYGKKGPLSITDANLVLGRLSPAFPQVFGPTEDQPLDEKASRAAFDKLAPEVNQDQAQAAKKAGKSAPSKLSVEEIAVGFVDVANECMARPIRALCQSKGVDAPGHDLVSFGGAGGQHMCGIAHSLGIKRIVVPRFSSLLSAYGLALADLVTEIQEPYADTLASSKSTSKIMSRLDELKDKAIEKLKADNGTSLPQDAAVETETFVNCRYQGTSNAIMISPTDKKSLDKEFIDTHRQRYGFSLQKRDIIVDDLRVRVRAGSIIKDPNNYRKDMADIPSKNVTDSAAKNKRDIFFASTGWSKSLLLPLEELEPGTRCPGPALLFDDTQTLLVEPGWTAICLPEHVVVEVDQQDGKNQDDDEEMEDIDPDATPDPVKLAVFGHRFMSLAEEMGTTLRQTAVSVNVKERLDFSCALFGSNGDLVSNAPHLPVHLGAMSRAVKAQIEVWKDKIGEGDVIVSNTPTYGGTHLPDITVMSPHWHNGKIIFWTASRAHHADIGGILPGSMPPHSKELWQEGAQIDSFRLVNNGNFDEEGITDLLLNKPAQYPGCSGTRTLADNLSDLRAQVSANQRGIDLVESLIKDQGGLAKVSFYMNHIQKAAEQAVRNVLKELAQRLGKTKLSAEQLMDDGSLLTVVIDIEPKDGSATFDFTGTSPQTYANHNAPDAIVRSVVIYVLRSLVKEDIPLNQGCLNPVKIIVPPKTLISPSKDAAVVAGNVETSQQLTDLVLFAFEACAGSQGTCNNFSFGIGGKDPKTGEVKAGYGFYETMAGGAGAGPGWHGQSGIHVHMSNTAITDVEQIERRYPVVVRQWSIRDGSGGSGKYRGGDGCIREIEFTRKIGAAILSESRSRPARGLCGGRDGLPGVNQWIRGKGEERRVLNLGGKAECSLEAGERILVMTPGGGGYGVEEEPSKKKEKVGDDEGGRAKKKAKKT